MSIYQRFHCPNCETLRRFRKRSANHRLHLKLTIATLGCWAGAWLVIAWRYARRRWRCTYCHHPLSVSPEQPSRAAVEIARKQVPHVDAQSAGLLRTTGMTMTSLKSVLVASALTALATSLTSCDVKKTEEGEAPKVNVEGGKLPKYDVKGPDVSVDKKEKTVTVPEVKVEKKEKTITVPDVNVKTGTEKRQEEEAAKSTPPQ